MGKFKNSNIHERYSDWHYQLIKQDEKYKQLYCCDVDRIWIEVDFKGEAVVAVLDLKYDDGPDFTSPAEKLLFNWLKEKGARVYIVWISQCFTRFRVVNDRGQEKEFNSIGFANWLLYSRKK